jgi:hypothetical protein
MRHPAKPARPGLMVIRRTLIARETAHPTPPDSSRTRLRHIPDLSHVDARVQLAFP